MQWSPISGLSHLIAIGAGNGDVLLPALQLAPKQVVVFEADANQAKQLAQQLSGQAKVHNSVIATEAQNTTLHSFNLAQCNALAPATPALAAIFPGLKTLAQQDVSTQELAQQLSTLQISGDNNMLLLELPAQNLALLQHLAAHDLLKHFNHVVVQHSAEPLYQGAATLTALQQFLTEQGYGLSQSDNNDPDFPLLQFYRDATALTLKALQQQNDAQAEQLKQLAQEKAQQHTELSKQLETAIQQAEQQKAELTKQLEAVKQQLATEQQKLAEQSKQAEQKKTELTQQLDTVKQQLAADQQKLAEQSKQAEQQKAELTKQLEIVKQQLATGQQKLLEQVKQSEHEKEELHKQLDSVKKMVEAERHKTDSEVIKNAQIEHLLNSSTTKLLDSIEHKQSKFFDTFEQNLILQIKNIFEAENFNFKLSSKIDVLGDSVVSEIHRLLNIHSKNLVSDISSRLEDSLVDLSLEDVIKIFKHEYNATRTSSERVHHYSEKITSSDESKENKSKVLNGEIFFGWDDLEVSSLIQNLFNEKLNVNVLRFNSGASLDHDVFENADNFLILSNSSPDEGFEGFKTLKCDMIEYEFEKYRYVFYDMSEFSKLFNVTKSNSEVVVCLLEKGEVLNDWRSFVSVIEMLKEMFSSFKTIFFIKGLAAPESEKIAKFL